MKNINWQQYKCRCSAIGVMLGKSRANPGLSDSNKKQLEELENKEKLTVKQAERLAELVSRKEKGDGRVCLSDTCITLLTEEYAWKVWGMARVTKKIMDIPQMKKGVLVEADSLALLSIVDGVQYKPNMNENDQRERVSNKYLTGEVDAYVGDSIMTATCIPDIKSTWDYPTFLCKLHEPILSSNDWQVKGYMDITGAPEGFIANCLINTPPEVVNGIRFRLLSMLNVATEEAPQYKEAWKILEQSMNFDRIPCRKRVFKQNVLPMTEDQRTFVYDRVKYCRDWLCDFHERMESMNITERVVDLVDNY